MTDRDLALEKLTEHTQIGKRLGSFLIEDLVFRGAHNEVFRCWDPLVGRRVAIKRMRVEGVDRRRLARRLWREARIRGALDHPNLLPLYSARRARGGSYLVAPWFPGGSLGDRFRGERLPRELLREMITGMASALDVLHRAGWVHGDLHWGNILLGSNDRPVLIDFASARSIGVRWCRAGRPTRLQVMPFIVAPEVWRGEPVDGRADLYSLGVAIYRGLTGRFPFEAEDLRQLPALHCEVPVPAFEEAGGIPSGLGSVVRRCLAKDPDHRFPTGADLARAVLEALQPADPTMARPRLFIGQSAVPFRKISPINGNSVQVGPGAAADRRARGRVAQEVASLTTQLLAVPAAMLALEDIGAHAAMARGARTPAAIAAACGAPGNTVGRLLDTLWKAGYVGEKDGDYFLPPPLEATYRPTEKASSPARPIRRAADFWGHLSHWAHTHEPFRRMDQTDGGRYSPVVGVLGSLFADRARQLASTLKESGELPGAPAILDVGAGSAVWSLALARIDPAAKVTAVDRPKVLKIARAAAAEAGLDERFSTLEGDWRQVPLPEVSFDVVFLANLCHLEPGAEVARLFQRLQPALRPGGLVVIVDTVPPDRHQASLTDLLYGLRMGLRTSRGDLHHLDSYRRWLHRAGLTFVSARRLGDTDHGLSAILARRPQPLEADHA